MITNKQNISVLFIGNSYTYFNESWNIFANVCKAQNITATVQEVTCGGYTLAQMNDKNDEYGGRVDALLKNNRYDVVFLQEQSLRPAINDAVLFFDAVRALTAKIKNAGAMPVLYETWGIKDGAEALAKHNLTQESMTQKLVASYDAIAEELQIGVSHVGTAFYLISTANKDLELYDQDKSHPSALGSYVVALTHFATLFKKSPIGISYKYFTDNNLYQKAIERGVHEAVFGKSILKEEYKISSVGVTKTEE